MSKVIFHQIFLPVKFIFHQMLYFIKGQLSSIQWSSSSSKDIFHQRSSSIKGHVPLLVVFHWLSSSIIGCPPSKYSSITGQPPSKVFFHQMSSISKGNLSLNFVFHQSLFISKGDPCLWFPSKVIFYQRLLSIKGCFHHKPSSMKGHLTWKIIFPQMLVFIKFIFHQSFLPLMVIFH